MWVDRLGGAVAGAAEGILSMIPPHRRGPSSMNPWVLRWLLLLLLLCGVVLWIDVRGGCAAAAACKSRPPIAVVSFRPDDNTPDLRRWGVRISPFPCTLAGTSTTAIQFCKNLLLSEQNRPRKKQKKNRKTQRECTLSDVHRENEGRERERDTQRIRGRCAQRDESSRSSRTKKNSCASFKYKCGEWRFTSSCSCPGEVARVEEVRMTRRRRRRSWLQTWTARRRRRERARCKCAGGGKGGDLENAKAAAATQSSVYIKSSHLRRSALPSAVVPLSASGS